MAFRIHLDEILEQPKAKQENSHNPKINNNSNQPNIGSTDLITFKETLEFNVLIRAFNRGIHEKTCGLVTDNILVGLLVFNECGDGTRAIYLVNSCFSFFTSRRIYFNCHFANFFCYFFFNLLLFFLIIFAKIITFFSNFV